MKENNEHKHQAIIEVIDFGPLKITGKFILKDTKRNKEESAEEILLCRCGRSANKPYCDCSHEK
jgi:CDGSH iron-sulfur domain-containing protein 3